MRIFLSYASAQRRTAEEIAVRLQRKHETFFDRDSLRASDAFDDEIRRALHAADLFIFLISPEALAPGAYTLTELGLARQRWRDPAGHVLPVLVAGEPGRIEDSYLRMLHILSPRGNVAAEVEAEVTRLARQQRRHGVGLVLALVASLAAVGWFAWLQRAEAPAAGRRNEAAERASDSPDAAPSTRDPQIRALLARLRDADTMTRYAAVTDLAKRAGDDPAAMHAVGRALADPNVLVRRQALESVAANRLGAAEIIDAVVAALIDPDAENQRAAAYVLAALGPVASAAVPALVRALHSAVADIPRFEGTASYYDPALLALGIVRALAQLGPHAREELASIAAQNLGVAVEWIEIEHGAPLELLARVAPTALVAQLAPALDDQNETSLPAGELTCFDCKAGKALRAAFATLVLSSRLEHPEWLYVPEGIALAAGRPEYVALSRFSQALCNSTSDLAEYAWRHLGDLPTEVAQRALGPLPRALKRCPKQAAATAPAVCRARESDGIDEPKNVVAQLARLSPEVELSQLAQHRNQTLREFAQAALQEQQRRH